jgi:hypothetical protein
MKNTLALACLVLLVVPILAAAEAPAGAEPQFDPKKGEAALKSIAAACDNGSLMDGSPCPDPAAVAPGSPDATRRGVISHGQSAPAQPGAAAATPGDTPSPPPPYDPNQRNDTMAGCRMGTWAAMLGAILGGPGGMLVFAMAGFSAGYLMQKLGD